MKFLPKEDSSYSLAVDGAERKVSPTPSLLEVVICDPFPDAGATSGRGNLVVNLTDSWLVCHELVLGTAEDSLFSEGRCASNLSSSMSSRWCGVIVRRERCHFRCRYCHLTE
ncbi:hypothetical protein TNCV_3603821 [Trichonephila clavipes]|nr:hypothetical protein TNCV_3603821 [Trichonephila clavipes]